MAELACSLGVRKLGESTALELNELREAGHSGAVQWSCMQHQPAVPLQKWSVEVAPPSFLVPTISSFISISAKSGLRHWTARRT